MVYLSLCYALTLNGILEIATIKLFKLYFSFQSTQFCHTIIHYVVSMSLFLGKATFGVESSLTGTYVLKFHTLLLE